eukprot:354713-Pelagomonas_calceolata.AAC.4
MMKIGGLQITLLASDPPKKAHSSTLDHFSKHVLVITKCYANILHVRKRKEVGNKLVGTLCAEKKEKKNYAGSENTTHISVCWIFSKENG